MFICLTVTSLRAFVNRALWVSLERECRGCFKIWNPSGVQLEMASFGTRAISEEINWRFGPFVVAGFALSPVLVSSGRDGPRLGGIPLIDCPESKKMN